MEKVIIVIGILFVFIGFLVWSTLMQKKALKGQQKALNAQAKAIEKEKEMMQLIEATLDINKAQLEEQKAISSLLREIKDKFEIKS